MCNVIVGGTLEDSLNVEVEFEVSIGFLKFQVTWMLLFQTPNHRTLKFHQYASLLNH